MEQQEILRCEKALALCLDGKQIGFTVAFGDGHLPCYFLRPSTDEIPRPTLIVATGGEGTNMEMYFWAAANGIKRGYNVLLFEGPNNPGGNFLGAQPLW